jgi:ABC-type polysaccharide/polyol phosphate transport system ATPase subunit
VPENGPAIEVGDISKRYVRRPGEARSLKTAVVERLTGRRTMVGELPWVLRNVSLSVSPRESVALIGPNGSGKTTLLGLISGVLRPTEGSIVTQGRVCVLLEAAVAFHPDLTGIENIMVQGMILGMTRSEVLTHLDEIIGFAGAEPYIEQPVRTFSLGQRARLGFAIASHLEPEVLLIDEVFAIVDEEYHHACYRRLRELRDQGCAVVFVSHVMEQVRAVCERAILLDEGQVVADGPTEEVIGRYEVLIAEHEGRSGASPQG